MLAALRLTSEIGCCCFRVIVLQRYFSPIFGFSTLFELNEQCFSPSNIFSFTTPHCTGLNCGSGSFFSGWHAALMTKLQLAANGIRTLIFFLPINPTTPTMV
jgi:hypothetical protein